MVSVECAALTLVAAFGAVHPLADLATHWRVVYVLGAAIASPILILGGRRERAFLLLTVPTIAANAAIVAPRWQPPPPVVAPIGERSTFDLLVFNVFGDAPRRDSMLRYIADESADLVLVLEVRPELATRLQDALPRHRIVAIQAQEGNYGLALLARRNEHPLDNSVGDSGQVVVEEASIERLLPPDESSSPSVEAIIRLDGRRLRLLGVHVPPPVTPARARRRGTEIRAAAERAASSDLPFVLAGDLNTSPWGADWAVLPAAGLLDAAAGRGVAGTWPAPLPWPLRIPLDHVLHDPSLVTIEHTVGPSLGSDHRPVRVRLGWRND